MTPRRRTFRALAAAVTLALSGMLTSTAAAQEGPVLITRQQQHDWLTLNRWGGDIELIYRGQRNDLKTTDNGTSSTSNFKEDRFEETLELRNTGAIYHPNLVSLDLAGKFGLFQSQDETDGVSDNSQGTLYEWDLDALGLRKEEISPEIYSRRTRQLITRDFGAAIDSTTTTTGAVLDIRNKTVPTRFEAYHLDETQSAPDNVTGEFDLAQDTATWHSEYRPDSHQVLSWDYTYNNVKQSSDNTHNNFQSNDATLAHTVNFGSRDKSNLASTVRYFDQTGDFPQRQFRWDEAMLLWHTDNFQTRYRYTFDQQSFGQVDQTINHGSASFIHNLYKSLETTGEVGVEKTTRSDDANTMLYYGNLNFTYHKQVPLGHLTAGLSGAWSRQENDTRSQPIQIFNEPHVMTDLPLIIAGNGIQPGSLVITDPSGILIYVPGLDYTVDAFPNQVQINRVIGGRIDSGQSVLIDYTLGPQPSNTTTTTYYSMRLRYDIDRGPLKGAGVYAGYSEQDQSADINDPNLVLNSFTDIVTGADYRFWIMQIGAERQWHDSTLTPFNATRYYARLVAPLNVQTVFSLNTAYDIFDYTDINNHLELWTVSATLQHRFSRDFYGTASFLWRDENDDLHGRSRGIEEQLELRWQHRQTSVYAQLRNAQEDSDFVNNSFQYFEIGLRRDF